MVLFVTALSPCQNMFFLPIMVIIFYPYEDMKGSRNKITGRQLHLFGGTLTTLCHFQVYHHTITQLCETVYFITIKCIKCL